jgi:hypothetical protein
MYGNQNNFAWIFQIHRDIANINQDGKPFVCLLGNLKRLLSELEIYQPHTIHAITVSSSYWLALIPTLRIEEVTF